MSEQYTSIHVVLDNLLEHPLLQGLTMDTAVRYTIEFLRVVDCPSMFIEKIEEIPIQTYKGALPCDYYKTIQVLHGEAPMLYATDTFFYDHKTTPNTYKIQGNYIFTSFKEGSVRMSYLAIAVDDDGFPLIPDRGAFLRALESYIKMKWFTIQFDLNKISGPVLQNAQQEYSFNVGQCQAEAHQLSLDKAESLFNSWNTVLMRQHEHRTHYKNLLVKQKLNL